jgi:hypothetical protein
VRSDGRPGPTLPIPTFSASCVRDGGLVRMERRARLPDRCVLWNAPASGPGLRYRLYRSDLLWNSVAILAVLAALGAIVAVQRSSLAFTVWLAVAVIGTNAVIVAVVYLYARRSFTVELKLRGRHARQTGMLRAVGYLAVLIIVMCCAVGHADRFARWDLLAVEIGVFAFLTGLSLVGVRRIRLRRLSATHAWLSGLGTPFRDGLPGRPL